MCGAEEDQRRRDREPLGKKAEKRKAAEETFDTQGLVPEALRQYMIVPPKKTRGRPAVSKNKEKPSKSQP